MSISDAANLLHIDGTTFYCFVQAGLLPRDDHRLYCFDQHIPWVRRATVLELKEKCLWEKELTQRTWHDIKSSSTNMIMS